MNPVPLSLDLIAQASSVVEGTIRKTPIEFSPKLTEILERKTYLKLENLQLTGSFKIRGALFRLSQLSPSEKEAGIMTCSAGNHGKAVAYVANQLGLHAAICVPKSVDQSKLEGIKAYGAEVVYSPHEGYDETELLAQNLAQEKGIPFISPYDDYSVMAANGGTLAKESIEQLPKTKAFVFPVGGGGLAAGSCYFVKENRKDIQLIGCQHQDSPALALSLEQGKAVTQLPAIDTVAGGIEGGIGEKCFSIIQSRIDDYCLVAEEQIAQGVRFMLEEHQYLVEPSAAVVIAAALNGKLKVKQGPIMLVLSGRNVSFPTLVRLLQQCINTKIVKVQH